MNCKTHLVILAFLFSFVYYPYAQTNPGKDTIAVKTTKITIASETNYPPFCIVDKNGKADGFAIELFKAIAEEERIETTIKIGTWVKIKQDLAEGKIDALPLIGRTPEREALYDFTFPYLTLHGAVFVREGTKGINSIADLKDKTVIVMKGDNAEEFVQRDNIAKSIITTLTFPEAFRLLAEGNYDAVITQRVLGIRLLKDLNIDEIVPLNFPLDSFRQDFCIAVKKGDTTLLAKLNEGLSVVIANGTYDKIHMKWFGPEMKERFTYNNLIKLLIYILIPIIALLLLIAVYTLRRLVKSRTKRLNEEMLDHKKTHSALHSRQILLNEMEKVSKVGGWVFDMTTKKVTWTEGVYGVLGVSPSEMEPSENDFGLDYLDAEDKSVFILALRHTIASGEPFDLELHLKTADGTLKWIRTSGHVEYNNGKIVNVFGNVIDISRQKEVESNLRKLTEDLESLVNERTTELHEKIEKLNKSQQAMLYMVEDLNYMTSELKQERQNLETAIKELESFSYSVSHDLRTPLRALDGFANILLEDYAPILDDEGKRLLNVIITNANKMGYLIDDLLAFSRLSRVEMKSTGINMQEMAASVFAEIATDKEKASIDIRFQAIPNANGDPALMRQVWINFINNAIKFTNQKQERIIEIGYSTEDNENAYFIKDNGAGFNMAYSNKLFAVFQRLHSPNEFQGTGIGLSIIQRIIQRHGGRVWAEGKVDEGATFYFSLPKQLN